MEVSRAPGANGSWPKLLNKVFGGGAHSRGNLRSAVAAVQPEPGGRVLALVEPLGGLQSHCVRFDGRQMAKLPLFIYGYTELRVLDISNNQLVCIDDNMGALRHLATLCAHTNELRHVSDRVRQCCKLERLSLALNPLNSVPECVPQLAALAELDLCACGITALPKAIGNLCNLMHLDCGQNQLREIPQTISKLRKLHTLILNRNRLRCVSNALTKCESITYVDMAWNELTEIPQAICSLDKLEYLDLRGNFVQTLPGSLQVCSKLQWLLVANNQINQMEHIHLPELECLDADHNFLTELSQCVATWTNLKQLCLRGNRLEQLAGDTFASLFQLQQLFVDDNQLTLLPSELRHCASLCILSASRNSLHELPDIFHQLPKLSCIDVRANLLCSLPQSLCMPAARGKLALWLSFEQRSQHVPLTCLAQGDQFALTSSFLPQTRDHAERRCDDDFHWYACSLHVVRCGRRHDMRRRNAMAQRQCGDGTRGQLVHRVRALESAVHVLPTSIKRLHAPPAIRPYAMVDVNTLRQQLQMAHEGAQTHAEEPQYDTVADCETTVRQHSAL